jgi:DNA repair protein RadC
MASEPEEKPHYHGHRQRLRQRLIEAGPGTLPDYEILEVLLFAANPRGDTKPLAKALIERFGSFAAVINAPKETLLGVDGVGEAALAQFAIAREAALRLLRAEVKDRPVLTSWQKLVDYCSANLAWEATERFHVLFLDRKNALIKDEAQQKGTVDHTPVYPREVVKRALELGASALIMVHNHSEAEIRRPAMNRDETRAGAKARPGQDF